MSTRRADPSDLTDGQWEQIAPLLPKRRDGRGRKAVHRRRELLNAIIYVTRNGCVWEALPHDYPPYKTVYDYYRKLCRRGVWVAMVDALRRQVRVQAGREAEASIGVLDSQSVKTTERGVNMAATATSG
jgi:putative transposase